MGELPAFDFRPSPHRPLVIMSGYSEAGRVYPHDGIRSQEETKAIHHLWMASGEIYQALVPFADLFDLLESETEGLSDEDDFDLMLHDHLFQRFKVADFRKAHTALAKARGES